ncbi:MAG: hypothetical protein LBJ67_09960 [Planctomycetaceae bacterium]|jgi:hypothetical protein|nr:hypothetical protein [Planctomycetaceae bacterium]
MKKKNILRKICVWSFICGIAFTATAAFAQQELIQQPDVVYTVNLSKTAELNLTKEILATTEFQKFYDALTTRIDAEYDQAAKKPEFPTKLADFLLGKVREAIGKENISSKDVLETFAEQFELIQVEGFVKNGYERLREIDPAMAKLFAALYMRITFVVKFHPAELGGIVEYFEDAKDKIRFELIEPDPDNFLVKFSDPNETISVYAGSRKIENTDTYAVVFSGDTKLIEQKLNQLQKEQNLFGENASAETFYVTHGAFDVLKQALQKAKNVTNVTKDAIRVIEQVEKVNFDTRDFNGKTGTLFQVTLSSEEAATSLKTLAEAGKVFLTFAAGSDNMDENGKKLINLILDTNIQQDGKELSAIINWSNDTVREIIKKILQDAPKNVQINVL